MVVLAAGLFAESAAREAAVHSRFVPQKAPRRRGRINRCAVLDTTPLGFSRCRNLACKELIPWGRFEAGLVVACDGCGCEHGTAAEMEALFSPGGCTHSGLELTTQGHLAEALVRGLPDLGGFGRLLGEGTYHSTFDDVVMDNAGDLRGVSIKSVDGEAGKNIAHAPSTDQKRRMTAYGLDHGFIGFVGVLVVIYYSRLSAEVYVREWSDRMKYFEINLRSRLPTQQPVARDVPFLNPFVDEAPARPVEPMPF